MNKLQGRKEIKEQISFEEPHLFFDDRCYDKNFPIDDNKLLFLSHPTQRVN